MDNELIINSTPTKITIALLENKKLVEIHEESKDKNRFCVGDIYLGKVKKVEPGLNAAFVAVGYEKDAFLHYHDLGPQYKTLNKFLSQSILSKDKRVKLEDIDLEEDIDKDGTINDILKSGQHIIVQIAKEPISTKGPRLTSEITLAGRYLVLVPFSNKVSVSHKVKDKEERERLKDLVQSIKPNNFGVIVRTVAENKKVADLHADMEYLVVRWNNAFGKFTLNGKENKILSEVDRISGLLRDLLNNSFNGIYVNDTDLYDEIKKYIKSISPDQADIVKYYSGKEQIFDFFGVEKKIKSSFGKVVTNESGGYLIIEHTEACHIIDVNSGNRVNSGKNQENNALEVNLEAAEEVARQLRLRDMGGIIVIDFIDMTEGVNRRLLYQKIKEVMKRDRAKHSVLPPSKFGLVQITRQRVRPEMNIEVMEICPSCKGSGKIKSPILFIDELEIKVRYILSENKNKNIVLMVHPYIESYLKKGLYSILYKWLFKYGFNLKLKSSNFYQFLEYRFFDSDGTELVANN